MYKREHRIFSSLKTFINVPLLADSFISQKSLLSSLYAPASPETEIGAYEVNRQMGCPRVC